MPSQISRTNGSRGSGARQRGGKPRQSEQSHPPVQAADPLVNHIIPIIDNTRNPQVREVRVGDLVLNANCGKGRFHGISLQSHYFNLAKSDFVNRSIDGEQRLSSWGIRCGQASAVTRFLLMILIYDLTEDYTDVLVSKTSYMKGILEYYFKTNLATYNWLISEFQAKDCFA
jgi:hypothetical protein